MTPEKLFNDLKTLGVPFTVAGGYPRDLLYGQTPKDIDICIHGTPETSGGFYDKAYCGTPLLWKYLKDNTTELEVYPAGTPVEDESGIEYNDPDIFEVWKCKVKGLETPVDFIFYHDHISSQEGLLEVFDVNFSQFVMVPIGGAWLPMYKGTHPLGSVKQVNPMVSVKRLDYITNKAISYGWKKGEVA